MSRERLDRAKSTGRTGGSEGAKAGSEFERHCVACIKANAQSTRCLTCVPRYRERRTDRMVVARTHRKTQADIAVWRPRPRQVVYLDRPCGPRVNGHGVA